MVKQNTIELFSGTGSFSRVALENGCTINTYDLADSADELVEGTHNQCCVLSYNMFDYPDNPYILWASPPCTTFSIASCSTHWTPDKQPKTKACIKGMQILERTVELIRFLRPKYYFIENPRGLMRKKIDPLLQKQGLFRDCKRHTITYCQYETDIPATSRRMKPTDIWTNHKDWNPRPVCKNGDPCHARAPRGSKTGTQGLKDNRARSVIPADLFKEIFTMTKECV